VPVEVLPDVFLPDELPCDLFEELLLVEALFVFEFLVLLLDLAAAI
jgi:hypothetical protein